MIGTHRWTFVAGLTLALVAGWTALPRAFYRSVPQPMQFSHQVHAGEAVGLDCQDCHAFTEDGRFAGIPPLQRCAECHESAIGESEAEKTLVEEYVTPGREIPWLVYSRQPDNVYFSHVQHTNKAGLECSDCHGDHGSSDTLRPHGVDRISGYSRDVSARKLAGVGAGRARGLGMDDCLGCHSRRGAPESCLTCHK